MTSIARRKIELLFVFHPRFMHRVSRVDIFFETNRIRLPETELEVCSTRAGVALEPETGIHELDKALRRAGEEITIEGLELGIRLNPRGVRVRVVGGTWLGGVFGQRIAEAVAYAERLSALISEGEYKVETHTARRSAFANLLAYRALRR